VNDRSRQPHTPDDDYDDMDRLSIKSDDLSANEGTCKSSEPLPPPRQKEISTTNSQATTQLVTASVGDEYASLKNCTSDKNLEPSKQQEAVDTTTLEPETPLSQPVAGDTSNDYTALITPPTASAGDYQKLVAAPPVPPGYDVPSNIPAISPITNTIEDNNSLPSS